jgi:hypothetical protein
MENVKRVFFLTEEEVKEQQKIVGNNLIDHLSPHYELENGEIMWGMIGYPAAGERFHSAVAKK